MIELSDISRVDSEAIMSEEEGLNVRADVGSAGTNGTAAQLPVSVT